MHAPAWYTFDETEPCAVHTFHRSILQQLLAKHLDASDRIHFAKRLASYSESSPTEPITLNFKDGTTATCDFVVGSDGIRSAVRRTMYNEFADEAAKQGEAEQAARLREMIEPVFSGQIAYRGLTPVSELSPELVEYSRSPQIVRLYCCIYCAVLTDRIMFFGSWLESMGCVRYLRFDSFGVSQRY